MMGGKRVNNVLLDLDGTLADTAPDLAFALNTVLEERGKAPLPLDAIRPSVSLGGIAMVRLAFQIDEDNREFAALKKRFLEVYRANIARYTVLFDGMHEVLACLDKKRVPWGIVTNKSTCLTLPLMDELRLASRTPCIVCGDTVEFSKPHPAPMLHACKLLRCAAQDTLYVGDARRDIEAGNRASMTTLVARYGYLEPADQPQTWGASGEIDSPLGILDWVN